MRCVRWHRKGGGNNVDLDFRLNGGFLRKIDGAGGR